MMFARSIRAFRTVSGAVPAACALLLVSCSPQDGVAPDFKNGPSAVRDLAVTYRAPSKVAVPGRSVERIGGSRSFVVYIPSTYDEHDPTPVALLLHGSGDRGATMIDALSVAAEQSGVVLIAPDADRYTWDLIFGKVGPDADYIERVLDWTFDHINVDASRLTLGGFSDGATYTAWLGLTNGDLFRQLVVMSGCAKFPNGTVSKPRVLMLHGSSDALFSVNGCVPLLLPQLQAASYDVQYIEFEGRHEISQEFSHFVMEFVAGN